MKTMKIAALLLLLVLSKFAFAEKINYLPYYQQVTSAESFICKDDFQSALSAYDAAFQLVTKPLAKDLYNAAICAALLELDNQMFTYMERSLEIGVPIKKYVQNTIVFAKYANNQNFCKLLENSDFYYKNYQSKLNANYIATLKNLDEKDQNARKKVKRFMWNFPELFKKRFDNWQKTDSCNQLTINSLVKLYGYPNQENVGIGEHNLEPIEFACMWHYCDSIFIYKTLYNSMLSGYVQPYRYAEKVEYSVLKKPYGTMYNILIHRYLYHGEIEKIPQEQREFLNENRRKIGMRTVEEHAEMVHFYKRTKNVYGFLISDR